MFAPSMSRARVSLPSGLTLQYVEQGRPGAPAVLLLHGYSDSWFSFSRVLPLLGDDVRAIVPDQRGHGASDKPRGLFSLRAFARDALDLLDELQIDRAIVVGHSMSGLVAQHVASLAPDRVQGLIVVGSALTARNHVMLDLADAVVMLEDPVNRDFALSFQLSTIHRPVPPDFLETAVQESLRLPAYVWKAVMHGMLSDDLTPRAASIACPVRVLWGDRDSVFSRPEQDALVAAIRGASLTVLPEVGHAVHWEVPEVLVEAVYQMLRR